MSIWSREELFYPRAKEATNSVFFFFFFGRNQIQYARYVIFSPGNTWIYGFMRLQIVRARRAHALARTLARSCLTLSEDTCERSHGAGDVGSQSFTIRYTHDGTPREGVVGNVQVFRGKERRWSRAARQLVASPRRRQGAGGGKRRRGAGKFSSIA